MGTKGLLFFSYFFLFPPFLFFFFFFFFVFQDLVWLDQERGYDGNRHPNSDIATIRHDRWSQYPSLGVGSHHIPSPDPTRPSPEKRRKKKKKKTKRGGTKKNMKKIKGPWCPF